VLLFAEALCCLGQMLFYRLKSKTAARNMWRQVNLWLSNREIKLHLALLVDFGDMFYTPEEKDT
jgi:hypothetical protein